MSSSVKTNNFSSSTNFPFKSKQFKKLDSEFLCKLKYLNTLPEAIVESKLLGFPFNYLRHVNYFFTSLEKSRLYEIPLSPRNIFEIKLSDLSAYPHSDSLLPEKFTTTSSQENNELSIPPENLFLANLVPSGLSKHLQSTFSNVNEANFGSALTNSSVESCKASGSQGAKSSSDSGSSKSRPNVSWLRKSEHSLSDSFRVKSSQDSSAHIFKRQQQDSTASEIMDDEKAIEIINKTFSHSDASIYSLTHPLHPSLSVKKVIPIFPDFETWPQYYVLALFDSSPHEQLFKGGSHSVASHSSEDQQSSGAGARNVQAFLSPSTNPNDPTDRFLNYFCSFKNPTPEKTLPSTNDDGGSHEIIPFLREYNINIKNEGLDDIHILSVKKDAAFYHPIQSKIILKSRRKKAKRPTSSINNNNKEDGDRFNDESLSTYVNPKELHLKRREFTPEEMLLNSNALKELELPQGDEQS